MALFLPLESRFRHMGYKLVAGMDEVGRGPLAGPVVSAIVILREDYVNGKLDDSKKLSRIQREKLFDEILENCLDYAISIVSHSTIDEINILNAVRMANLLCTEHLKIKPDLILIDGHDKQTINLPFATIVRGDNTVKSIAAASILAKVVRDKIMLEYAKEYPNYGFETHVGYCTRSHCSNLKKYGRSEIHRKSFSFK